ncbi:hypothetical protein GMA3_30 [Gordonia phage GMA3]|uniref:Uncharacterized protein n=1 Tax=Gordonia phage GMA3 TaxID=1647284 RepID=A0A0K0NKY5_9CAUD|nr:membrane protein [Gordonia phage GMA3]AKL88207.1 hypothetical protein GMA3_30 [Gordonia phage GMA3]
MNLDEAQFWVQLAVTLLSTGGLFGGYKIWSDRKKADAEVNKEDASAADIIQGSAAREIQRINETMEKMRKESLIRKRAGAKLYYHQRSHERWDLEMMTKLRELGISVDEPPRILLSVEELDALEI